MSEPTIANTHADDALKAKHRAMWALGDYPAAAALIGTLGTEIVTECGIDRGDRVLDVAAGAGNASLPAARVGAHVVASDLTPALLAAGEAAADTEGLSIQWRVADAEALPFPNDSFDAVISVVGVMFAPHHQAAADELTRVCRPGGTIGLINWTPRGFIGHLLAAVKPYVAPPPPGVQPAPLWGDEQHLAGLIGDRLTEVEAQHRAVPIRAFGNGASFREFFKARYGPVMAAYRQIADDPASTLALDDDLAALADSHLTGEPPVMDWEYLLYKGRLAA